MLNSVLLLTFISLIVIPAFAVHAQDSGSDQGPFIHTVFFWLNNPDSDADSAKLLEGLRSLEQIDLIKEGHVGVPADTDREVIDSSYDYSITFIFANKKDEQAYQSHPNHLEFVEKYSDLWKRVVVYDTVPPSQ